MNWYKIAQIEQSKRKARFLPTPPIVYDYSEYPLEQEYWILSEDDKEWRLIKAYNDDYRRDMYFNMPVDKKSKIYWKEATEEEVKQFRENQEQRRQNQK